MKIIDLYNMVANKEQPKKFTYKGHCFAYHISKQNFVTIVKDCHGDSRYVCLNEMINLSNLNDEVEMLNYKRQYIINEDRLIELLEKENKLYLLEGAGVENWLGYDFAFEDKEELDIEKILEENFKEIN